MNTRSTSLTQIHLWLFSTALEFRENFVEHFGPVRMVNRGCFSGGPPRCCLSGRMKEMRHDNLFDFFVFFYRIKLLNVAA